MLLYQIYHIVTPREAFKVISRNYKIIATSDYQHNYLVKYTLHDLIKLCARKNWNLQLVNTNIIYPTVELCKVGDLEILLDENGINFDYAEQ